MKKNIIVTGGAGFIGSCLVRKIISQTEHKVLNIDKLTYAGNLVTLRDVENSERYSFLEADICDKVSVQKAFSDFKPDIIIHLAAESHVDKSIQGAEEFINTNIVGTFKLLEIATKYFNSHSASQAKNFLFHHVSTDEVYGDLEPNEDAFTELTPYHPSSPYSASKAASDHLVTAWARTYGLPAVISNCSNNYGAFQNQEKLIPTIIRNAILGCQIPIYGSGQQIRDWLYVEDHAEALLQIALSKYNNQRFNIGGCNELTNLEVAYQICNILRQAGTKIIEHDTPLLDLITHVSDRPGHDHRYAINISKISSILNWQPKETFESGLRKTVNWYLQNPEWLGI